MQHMHIDIYKYIEIYQKKTVSIYLCRVLHIHIHIYIYAGVVPGLVFSDKFISGVCLLGNLQVDVVQDFVLGMKYRYVHLHI